MPIKSFKKSNGETLGKIYSKGASAGANINLLLPRLDDVKELRAKKHQQSYTALCPAHADKKPSLCIDLTHNDRILLYCRAGCGGAAITAAVGLSLADLYTESSRKQPPGFNRPLYNQKDYEEAYTTGQIAQGYIDRGIKTKPSDLPHIKRSIKILTYFQRQIEGGHYA